MNNKVILTIAPTGNVPTKAMTPHVPVSPAEIAAQIYDEFREATKDLYDFE